MFHTGFPYVVMRFGRRHGSPEYTQQPMDGCETKLAERFVQTIFEESFSARYRWICTCTGETQPEGVVDKSTGQAKRQTHALPTKPCRFLADKADASGL